MRQALTLHPHSRYTTATRVEVNVARPRSGTLVLGYAVGGSIRDLRLPPVTTPARADGLWRHTCFEAFVRAAPGAAYYEFNFAPSARWAAYGFSDYRRGVWVASEMSAPRFEVELSGECYRLAVSLKLDRLPGLPSDAVWQLGLSAVIEKMRGGRSYWALAHPPGKPDFHHSDCFAHELPAA